MVHRSEQGNQQGCPVFYRYFFATLSANVGSIMTTEVSSNLNNIGFGSSLMPVVIIIDKPISPKLIEAAINILVVIFSI
jgi:hypothetical protein